MSLLLFFLYPFAIQYERTQWPLWVRRITGWVVFPLWLRAVLFVVAIPTLVIDVIANYTELALITWDRPAPGEYTFSTRMKRLQYYPGFRGWLARLVRDYTNYFDPQGDHV